MHLILLMICEVGNTIMPVLQIGKVRWKVKTLSKVSQQVSELGSKLRQFDMKTCALGPYSKYCPFGKEGSCGNIDTEMTYNDI